MKYDDVRLLIVDTHGTPLSDPSLPKIYGDLVMENFDAYL